MDLWDVFQQGQINDAVRDATFAREEAKRANDTVHQNLQRLDAKVEALALINQALWELLRGHSKLTDQDVLAKMDEIDHRDGRLDGRMTGRPYPCPKCNRPVHTSHTRCLWCKHPLREGEAVLRSTTPL